MRIYRNECLLRRRLGELLSHASAMSHTSRRAIIIHQLIHRRPPRTAERVAQCIFCHLLAQGRMVTQARDHLPHLRGLSWVKEEAIHPVNHCVYHTTAAAPQSLAHDRPSPPAPPGQRFPSLKEK